MCSDSHHMIVPIIPVLSGVRGRDKRESEQAKPEEMSTKKWDKSGTKTTYM